MASATTGLLRVRGRAIATAIAVVAVSCCGVGNHDGLRAQPSKPPATQQKVHSVAWLVDQKDQWSGWSSIRRRLVVEGRYSFLAATRLRMRGCALDFVAEKNERLPKTFSDSKNVELQGRFEKRDGEVVFVVAKLAARPDDATKFQSMKTAVQASDPDDWYELAEWAEQRGAFYDDDELLKSAAAARSSGLKAELAKLDPQDTDGLLELATKAEGFDFDPRVVAEYRHRAWRLRWDTIRKAEEPATTKALKEFAAQLEKALPKCLVKPTPQELADGTYAAVLRSYRRLPVEAYESATEAQRLRLHRAFYAEIALVWVLRDLDPDGGNEETVAADIERQLPEYASRAKELRTRALARVIASVGTMTRTEMTRLADRLRAAGEPGQARKVLNDWLRAKEKTLRADGADGLVQAADYYESLTSDKDKVAELLIEANGLDPESREIAGRLERIGYRLRNGSWVAGNDLKAPVDRGPSDVAVRNGMSPDRVREVLGTPRTVTRIATAGQVSEVWIYGPRNASGFAVHFLRSSTARVDESRVVKVLERRPR